MNEDKDLSACMEDLEEPVLAPSQESQGVISVVDAVGHWMAVGITQTFPHP